MGRVRVTFQRELFGVPFAVTSIEVRRARSLDRGVRVAELKFSRLHGVDDWRMRADAITVKEVRTDGSAVALGGQVFRGD